MKIFSLASLGIALIMLPRLAFSEAVDLARDGKPLLSIIVSEKASDEVYALAQELAQALKTITGGEFAIEKQPGAHGIILGTSEEWPGYLPETPKETSPLLCREDYLLRAESGRLMLIGRTPLAVQNALWDFLYRTGFRQYFPGRKWEMWQTAPSLSMEVDAVESPAYFTRRLRVGSTTWPENVKAVEEWKRRNRMVSGFRLSSGHVYGRIIARFPDFFTENPGSITGTGSEQKLDASQESIREIVGQYALQEMRTSPAPDSISLEPSDGGGWREDSPLGSPSNQAVTLANHAAQILREAYPGRKVGIYAYNLHSPPPDIAVDSDVIVGVATSFIKNGYTATSLMQKWRAKGAGIGVREYLGVSAWDFGLPGRSRASDIDYVTRTIPEFHKLGARYWDSEVTEAWGVHGLGHFLAARFLWDTREASNKEALFGEFLQRSFGRSAEPMRELFETCLLKTGKPILSNDLIGRMYRLLDKALQAENSPEVTARIFDFVLYTRYVELMFQYQNCTGPAKRSAFDELVILVQGNSDSFMFDRWTIFREIPGRVFRIKKNDIMRWMQPALEKAKPLGEEELRGLVAGGIVNNPLLDFKSLSFSNELVPFPSVDSGKGKVKSRPILLRGNSVIYLFAEREKGVFEFTMEGGVIYRNRGPVEVRLFSDQHPLLDEPVTTATIEPDRHPHRIVLSSPYSGKHRLEISDGSGGVNVQWPDGQRAVLPISSEEGTTLYGTYTMTFFVPKGTKSVSGYTSNQSGRVVTGGGKVIYDFSVMNGPGYFSIDVPEGKANACWSFQGVKGRRLLMTVPTYLARFPDELMIPRETQTKEP